MNQKQRQAYEWSKNQHHPSVAARYAKILAGLVDEITPPNESLTLEQLREMDGEPVWLETAEGSWGLVDANSNRVWLKSGTGVSISLLGGIAYRHPPEREEDT